MSTRAGIIIKDKFNSFHFYRHSDGYPEGTLPTLEKFLQYVKDEKIRNYAPQAAGWLIIIGADEYNGSYGLTCVKCGNGKELKNQKIGDGKERKCPDCGSTEDVEYAKVNKTLESLITPTGDTDGMGWKVGAYEPTDDVERHGDLEYIYRVDLDKKVIHVKNLHHSRPQFRKVAG